MKLFLTFLLVAATVANASTVRVQSAADLPAKCSSLVQAHGVSVVKFLANLDPKRVPDLGVLCDNINGCDDSLKTADLPHFKAVKAGLVKAVSTQRLRVQRALSKAKQASKSCPMTRAGEECSGNGACIMECGTNGEKQAKCMCDSRYGGEDCSQDLCPGGCGNGVCKRGKCFCDPGWKGTDCKTAKVCKGASAKGPCSGNGLCKYGKCFCDVGFEGKGCEISSECPNNCNKNGICWKGKCKCNPGWVGEACGQFSNKKACKGMTAKGPCSGNGICFDGRCVCSPQFVGEDCSMQKKCTDDCSGHGKCFLGQCMCNPGYEGDACEKDIPCDCNGKGVCKAGQCHCVPGYEGESCEKKSECPNKCSGHGVCSSETCYCFPGWAGESCGKNTEQAKEQARVTAGCPTNCNGHGVCGYGLGDAHGNPLGQCLCQPGWHGASCEHMSKCPGEAGGCEGHGQCIAGKCFCRPGWKGPRCLQVVFNHTKCPNGCGSNGVCMLGECFCNPGFAGEDCSRAVKCPGKNGKCNGRGECSMGKCFCTPGFTGDACETRETCPKGCSNNGVCVSGKCLCVPGYTGPACDHAPSCETNPCENGVCAQGKCFCADGFTGPACTLKVPEPSQNTTLLKQACKNQCSGHGTCDLSNLVAKGNMCFKCNCAKHWTGEDCSEMIKPQEADNSCNLVNADCGVGGKIDEKSCRCICGDCHTGKFCKVTKDTPECKVIKEKDFKKVNHNVIDRTSMVKNDPLADAEALKRAESLVVEGADLDKTAEAAKQKVADEFQQIQSGAMIEVKASPKCPNGCSGRGKCNKAGICECFSGFAGKDCTGVSKAAAIPVVALHKKAEEEPKVQQASIWHTQGVLVVAVAMFIAGLGVGLVVKMVSDRRQRASAEAILEEQDSSVSYSSLNAPLPSIGL